MSSDQSLRRVTLGAFCLIVVAWAASFGSRGAIAAGQDIRAAIEDQIKQRHPSDSPEWWRALGAGTPPVIISMYDQPALGVYERTRLLNGLSAFGDSAQARDFLRQQAQSARNSVLQDSALKAVGAAEGADAVEFLSKFLGSDELHIRIAAAEALKRIDDSRAQARLKEYLAHEKTPGVAARLEDRPVPAPKRLYPVSTTEDRASPELAGTWKGFWVAPAGKDIRAVPIALRITLSGVRVSKVELATEIRGTRPSAWKFIALSNPRAKGSHLEAKIPGKKPILIEAEQTEQDGTPLIQAKTPVNGGLILLRKLD